MTEVDTDGASAPGDVRRRRRWPLVIAGAVVLVALPLLFPATMPPDARAPARIAPYIEMGRRSLLNQQDHIRALPHRLRYAGARCSGDAVALLFDAWVYPSPGSSGAIAVNGAWPPADARAFGGAYSVEDFDAALSEGWVTERTWHQCEPA